MKRLSAGFTLIELLVVIAIIAILSAILFPVFAKVREKARQTSCVSNIKQLGLGFQQYTQDYDETMPSGNTPAVDGRGWAGQLYPFTKSTGIYKCPDDSTAQSGDLVTCSYGYNRNLTKGTTGATYTNTLAALNSPVKTVLLFEVIGNTANIANTPATTGGVDIDSSVGTGGDGGGGGWNDGSGQYDTGYLGNPLRSNNGSKNPTGRHTDGSNYLLADGHAKWLKGASVSPGLGALTSTSAQGADDPAPRLSDGGTSYKNNAAGTDVQGFTATFSGN